MSERRSLTDWTAEGFVPEADLPPRVSLLRWKLGRKAKHEPTFRFYNLFGHVLRRDVLEAAWLRVSRNRGSAGSDGVTIEAVATAEGGVARWLDDLAEALRSGQYRPQPVRRVQIPKPDGRLRPLGIPTVRDRVAQMAVVLVIEPIFEADFEDCSYGFRPGRSAHQALDQIRATLAGSRRTVYDADLTSYFDTIDHARLLQQLRRRITDGSVLRLIRLWLRCPVLEDDGRGGTKRTTPTRGTPQGGVISPLLANVYLHHFDRAFHGPDGPAQFARARLVRYADDFVVLAKYMGPRLIAWLESELEGALGLTLNRAKTRTVDLSEPGTSCTFLGFTVRFDRDRHGRDRRYLNVVPSSKALGRIREKVREVTRRGNTRPLTAVVEEVDLLTHSWATYFRYGYPRAAFRDLNHFVRGRFQSFLRSRSQRRMRPFRAGESLYAGLQRYGLRYL